jgi:hypothetical protein
VESGDCRRVACGEAGPFLASNTIVASYASASQFELMDFTYVYILQSEVDPERFYTGLTKDLRERIKRHNAGGIPHTSKWRLCGNSRRILLCQIDSARQRWKSI